MTAAGPEYAWYGDDLTGATDTLAAIARRGRRAFLFLDVPTPDQLAAAGLLDAIGVAGAARSMSPDQMRATLAPVAHFFAELAPRIVHYKCCSTFDSAPAIGNIATAIETLRPAAANPVVPILGGQPSLGRYCAFSTLFATAGDRAYRIDRHPTMSRHPSTPMTEPDLTRHFAALGLDGVGAVHWPAINDDDIDTAWRQAAKDASAVLLDTLTEAQLTAIGGLLRRLAQENPTLVVGATSVAEAWFGHQAISGIDEEVGGDGPVLAFIGSLSPVTRRQALAARSYHLIEADPADVPPGSSRRGDLIAEAGNHLAAGRNVMVSTAPLTGESPAAALPGLAEASARLIDAILEVTPVRRLAIAGGDTSSFAASTLGFWGLAYNGLAARGVTVCEGRSDDPSRDGMLLMLKGGQMGPDTLFDDFARPDRAEALRA